MNVTQQDIRLIIEFDRELEKQLKRNYLNKLLAQAFVYSKKLQEKPFKFSEKSKKKMIRDVIKDIKGKQ